MYSYRADFEFKKKKNLKKKILFYRSTMESVIVLILNKQIRSCEHDRARRPT